MTKLSTEERLTPAQLEAIRERVEKAKEYGEGVGDLVFEDIPKLLAEIERLKNDYKYLKYYIEDSEANCVYCGDSFMPKVSSEATLLYCGNCREELTND